MAGLSVTYALSLDAVRWGIAELKRAKVHPFFLAYLHLRSHASTQGTRTMIRPDWEELGEHLAVPGGPPGKPFYRPMWHGNVNDVSRYWLNPNIAGSYAPSSIRGVPRKVIDTDGSEYILRPNHAQLARTHLIYDDSISSLAFAAFYYRDFGFVNDEEYLPGPLDLEGLLRSDLHFGPDDDEFELLFHTTIPDAVDEWFVDMDDEPAGIE